MKLVGYTETIHALLPKLHDESAVVLFGGRAKDRPYPGSVTVTSVNGAMSSMIRALATELKPIRFNAIHPGIVGDSPYWAGKPQALENTLARTPTGRLVTMADIVDAVVFLLENRGGERHQPVRGRRLAADVGTRPELPGLPEGTPPGAWLGWGPRWNRPGSEKGSDNGHEARCPPERRGTNRAGNRGAREDAALVARRSGSRPTTGPTRSPCWRSRTPTASPTWCPCGTAA